MPREMVPGHVKRGKRTELFPKELVAETLEYTREVAKHAWGCWQRLPQQTKQWLSVEELIHDGLLNLMQYERAWRPLEGTDRLRSMGYALVSYYQTYYIAPYCKAKKRFKVWTDENGKRHEYGRTISIEAQIAQVSQSGKHADLETALGIDAEFVDPLVNCIAVYDLCQVYHHASEELQSELVRWFLKPDTRFLSKGDRFKSVKKEFRVLARDAKFNITEARHILKSPVCLDSLSRTILQIPYNLDVPAPDLRPGPVVPVRIQVEK